METKMLNAPIDREPFEEMPLSSDNDERFGMTDDKFTEMTWSQLRRVSGRYPSESNGEALFHWSGFAVDVNDPDDYLNDGMSMNMFEPTPSPRRESLEAFFRSPGNVPSVGNDENDNAFKNVDKAEHAGTVVKNIRTFSESDSLDLHSGLPFEELKLDFGDLNAVASRSRNDSFSKEVDLLLHPRNDSSTVDEDNFDLASYLMDGIDLYNSPKKSKLNPNKLEIVNSGVQKINDSSKIDTEEYVDVESLSDCENAPALAANNLDSLLEQFEATEDVKRHKVNSNKTSYSEMKLKDHISSSKLGKLAPKIDSSCPPLSRKIDKSILLDHSYCYKEPAPDEELVRESSIQDLCISKSGKSCVIYGDNKSLAKSSQSLLKPTVQKELSLLQASKVIQNTSPKQNSLKTKIYSALKISPIKHASKRKLNLEEYKLRRGSSVRSCENSRTCSPISYVMENIAFSMPNSPAPSIPEMKTEELLEENALTNELQSMTPDSKPKMMINKPLFDPIAEASRKALQLKRAAMKKPSDDQIILSKIPKVETLVILPLATENGKLLPMVREVNECDVKEEKRQIERIVNSDYEEIVMVSIGVNTEVVEDPKSPIEAINKVEKDIKFTPNSLISSIKNELEKKLKEEHNDKVVIVKAENSADSHGENKVIMHLKKDRVRPEMKSIEVQTDISNSNKVAQDEPDPTNVDDEINRLISDVEKSISRRSRSRTKRKFRNYRNHHSASSDRIEITTLSEEFPHETTDSGRNSRSESSSSNYSSSSNSSRSSSSSSFNSRSSSSSSCSSCSSRSSSNYRSRSPRRKRRSRKYSNRKDIRGMKSETSVEERKVVFIGKLEPDISRRELAAKFEKFGTVVAVTLHSKKDGSRYGFVTFLEASQCYEAVDKAPKDPQFSRYDISFGGRRTFCGQLYADLDNLETLEDEYYIPPEMRQISVSQKATKPKEPSFDSLLQEMLRRKQRVAK